MELEDLIRLCERQRQRKTFNIIGFSNASTWRPTKHCVHHPGTRLIPAYDENGQYIPDQLQCPECGSKYVQNEAPTAEGIKGKFEKTKTRIISPKSRKKKYYDQQGNEITDPDLIQDIISKGINVIRYHEEKPNEDTRSLVR